MRYSNFKSKYNPSRTASSYLPLHKKNELLELLSEKETVIHTKSKQISALNDKFHKITKAVSQMEREVILLRKDNAALQEDNKKLKRHLNIREKEVTALVTRCTAQEEKLSEGKSSRMIEKQLKELQVKFHSSQEQLKQLDSLQEKLVRSEAERDAASGKIDRLFVENKDLGQHIVDTKQRLELQLDSRDVSLHAMKRQMQDLVGLKEEHGKRCDSLSAELKECHVQMQTMEGTIQGMKLAHRDEIVLMEKLLMERNSEEVSKHQQQQQDILEALTIAKDDEIMELKRQLKDGDAALAAVLKDVVTLKQENEQVTQDRDVVQMEKNEMIEDHRKEKESHTKEVAIWSTLAETKTEEIDLLNGTLQELENNKSHTTGQTSQLKEQIRSLEDQISALTVREEALVKADRIAAQTIQHLEGDLQDMEKVAVEMEQNYESKLTDAKTEMQTLKDEYEDMLLESEGQFKEQDAQYESQRRKVEKLRNESEQINKHSIRQEELRQMEMKILEESVAAAKEQIELKDKEWSVKNIELREERSKVIELEATVNVLERTSRKTELDANIVVEELYLKVEESTARYAKLEEEKERIVLQSRKAMDKLQDKISSLENEFTDLKSEIVSKDSQLEQRQETVNSLMNTKEELEKKILSYRGDLETLMTAYDETKEEYSNAVGKMKNEKEKENVTFRADYEELQTLATETQDELETRIAKNEILRVAVAERNKMIDDLATCNNALKEEEREKLLVITELQDRWKIHLKEIEEVKMRNAQLRAEKEKEFINHIDAMDEERSLRDDLEQQVRELQSKLEETVKEVKSTAELKAENYLLQDKIDRQEAYMKRKLETEKKKKGIISAAPMKSPPRPTSARSRSVTRRSVDQPPRLKHGVQRNRSTRSASFGPVEALALQRSASDELDDLLADESEV